MLRVEEKMDVRIDNEEVPLRLVVIANPNKEVWNIETILYFEPVTTRMIVRIVMKYYSNEYLYIESFRNYATRPNTRKSTGFTLKEEEGLRGIGKRVLWMLLCVLVTRWPFLLDKGEYSIVYLEAACLVIHIMECNDAELVRYYQKLGFRVVKVDRDIEGTPMLATVHRLLEVAELEI